MAPELMILSSLLPSSLGFDNMAFTSTYAGTVQVPMFTNPATYNNDAYPGVQGITFSTASYSTLFKVHPYISGAVAGSTTALAAIIATVTHGGHSQADILYNPTGSSGQLTEFASWFDNTLYYLNGGSYNASNHKQTSSVTIMPMSSDPGDYSYFPSNFVCVSPLPWGLVIPVNNTNMMPAFWSVPGTRKKAACFGLTDDTTTTVSFLVENQDLQADIAHISGSIAGNTGSTLGFLNNRLYNQPINVLTYDNIFIAPQASGPPIRGLYYSNSQIYPVSPVYDLLQIDNPSLNPYLDGADWAIWYNGFLATLHTSHIDTLLVFNFDMSQYWVLQLAPQDLPAQINLVPGVSVPNRLTWMLDNSGIIWAGSDLNSNPHQLFYSFSPTQFGFSFPAPGTLNPITLPCYNTCSPVTFIKP